MQHEKRFAGLPRSFFAMRHGAAIFRAGGVAGEAPCWRRGSEEALRRWQAGTTGIPFVDANMRELSRTGARLPVPLAKLLRSASTPPPLTLGSYTFAALLS